MFTDAFSSSGLIVFIALIRSSMLFVESRKTAEVDSSAKSVLEVKSPNAMQDRTLLSRAKGKNVMP